jgi:cytochrome c peroxidase
LATSTLTVQHFLKYQGSLPLSYNYKRLKIYRAYSGNGILNGMILKWQWRFGTGSDAKSDLSSVKHRRYRIGRRFTAGILLLLLLLSSTSFSAESALDLRHEPIQPLVLPELNAAKVRLGEKLFHEPRLARDNDMSCASCHFLESGGADGLARSVGRGGQELDFNAHTVFNSSLNHRLFWDGRAKSLEEQINFVVAGELEFSTSWPVIIGKLEAGNGYKQHFGELYADGITAANVRDAIATFERSLMTINSRFDRYLRGNSSAITEQEKSGYRLFKAYGCVACHQGPNVGGNLFQKLGVFQDFFGDRKNLKKADLGRFNFTGKEYDRHVFRVPSLRLVTLTPPYFHDGSAKTLEDAIKVMAKYQLGRILPEAHIEDIIAFLKSLVGEYGGRPLAGSDEKITDSEVPVGAQLSSLVRVPAKEKQDSIP